MATASVMVDRGTRPASREFRRTVVQPAGRTAMMARYRQSLEVGGAVGNPLIHRRTYCHMASHCSSRKMEVLAVLTTALLACPGCYRLSQCSCHSYHRKSDQKREVRHTAGMSEWEHSRLFSPELFRTMIFNIEMKRLFSDQDTRIIGHRPER